MAHIVVGPASAACRQLMSCARNWVPGIVTLVNATDYFPCLQSVGGGGLAQAR